MALAPLCRAQGLAVVAVGVGQQERVAEARFAIGPHVHEAHRPRSSMPQVANDQRGAATHRHLRCRCRCRRRSCRRPRRHRLRLRRVARHVTLHRGFRRVPPVASTQRPPAHVCAPPAAPWRTTADAVVARQAHAAGSLWPSRPAPHARTHASSATSTARCSIAGSTGRAAAHRSSSRLASVLALRSIYLSIYLSLLELLVVDGRADSPAARRVDSAFLRASIAHASRTVSSRRPRGAFAAAPPR